MLLPLLLKFLEWLLDRLKDRKKVPDRVRAKLVEAVTRCAQIVAKAGTLGIYADYHKYKDRK